MQKKKRPLRQDAAAGAGRTDTMQVAALQVAALAVCLFKVSGVEYMVSDEIEAGNEKPRAGAGAGSLFESGIFCYAPARPAPVGSVISTSTSSDAAARAGVEDKLAVVLWRCSISRDNHRRHALSTLAGVIALNRRASPAVAAWLRLKPPLAAARSARIARIRANGACMCATADGYPAAVIGLRRFCRFSK
ncbi:hypothetical protein [Stenotrophomonas nitritireducens]|uniref:hypothetical protein n=1 Tax=Stenotrophomonas nitritireducens TaxID=83617 RepID=UPI0012E9C9DF|nr:hypothetical protein [Stenotrophomonas nitritireducens]